MPNKKISELPIASILDGTELFPVVQGGTTKQVTKSLITETNYTQVEKTKLNNLALVAVSGSYNDLTDEPNYKQLNTFADMISLGTVLVYTMVKVLNDENKNQTNTIYQLWPDGVRIWMAGIKDN